MAQSVEHVIGNDEVISSILITSSKTQSQSGLGFSFAKNRPQRFSSVGDWFIFSFFPYPARSSR